jgi:hypothetical protein
MFTEGLSYQKTITMETVVCCNCGVPFGMPSDLRSQLMNDPDKWFFCPNGHRQHYSKSNEKIQREDAERKLKAKEAELLQEQMKRIQIEGELGKATRKLKRVQKGVCPCCNRTFQDLARHMETKHPEVKKPKTK